VDTQNVQIATRSGSNAVSASIKTTLTVALVSVSRKNG
jgi:hypothetical protein